MALVSRPMARRQNRLVEQARARPASAADQAFYQGKVESCRYFARHVLPGLTLSRKLVEASELSLMQIDEAVF